MKRSPLFFCCSLFLLLLSLCACLQLRSHETALLAASAYVPADAQLTRTQSLAGSSLLVYLAKGTQEYYKVRVEDGTQRVSFVQTEALSTWGATEDTLTQARAESIVRVEHEDAQILCRFSSVSDGRYRHHILFRTPAVLAAYTLHASNGAIIERSFYPDESHAALDPFEIASVIHASHPLSHITSLAFEEKAGALYYTGIAYLEDVRYAFWVHAHTGILTQWKPA